MSPLHTAVTLWLSSKHINVLPEWTEACVEWIHNECQEEVLSDDQLRNMVYEQWLGSDLTEIATPSLPQDLTQQNKAVVQGSYTLQINSIQDVGSSAYSQLIKIKGKENENVKVSAAQAFQSRFEPKPSRMLMMEVTDGHQKLQAMEYQHIPALNTEIPPGTKILIQGRIMCRLGVLTLQPRDVKVLGGEVEDLVVKNSQEQLLARLLGMPLDDPPGQSAPPQPPGNQVPKEPPNQELPQLQSDCNSSTRNERKVLRERSTDQYQSNISQRKNIQGFVNNIQESTGGGRQLSDMNKSRKVQIQSTKVEWMGDPDQEAELEDELNAIDEEILREFEEAQCHEMLKENTNKEKKSKVAPKSKPPPEWPSDEDTDEEMLAAMIDKLEEQIKTKSKQPKQEMRKGDSKGAQGTQRVRLKSLKVTKGKPLPNSAANATTSNSIQKQTSISNFLKPRNHEENLILQNPDSATESRDDKPLSRKLSLKTRNNSSSQFATTRKLPPTNDIDLPSEQETDLPKENENRLPEITAPPAVFIKEEMNSDLAPVESCVNFRSPERIGMFRSSSGTSVNHPKVAIATRITKEDDSEMTAKRRRLSTGRDSNQDPPFSYLAEMMDSIKVTQQPVTFDIRGFIITLLSPLGKRNEQWSLQVRLNDGSASLDAVLSDQVLQSLIGYSVKEMKQMRAGANNKEDMAAVEIKQKKALERCRKRLIDLCEIMTIRIAPGDMPTVEKMRSVEWRDCRQMEECLHH